VISGPVSLRFALSGFVILSIHISYSGSVGPTMGTHAGVSSRDHGDGSLPWGTKRIFVIHVTSQMSCHNQTTTCSRNVTGRSAHYWVQSPCAGLDSESAISALCLRGGGMWTRCATLEMPSALLTQ
jgi:hypothetical protein